MRTERNFLANFSLYRCFIQYVKELIVFNGAYTIEAIYSRTYSTGISMVLSLYLSYELFIVKATIKCIN